MRKRQLIDSIAKFEKSIEKINFALKPLYLSFIYYFINLLIQFSLKFSQNSKQEPFVLKVLLKLNMLNKYKINFTKISEIYLSFI